MSDGADVVIIGSGINSLVCAAEVALRGRLVCVLERSAVLGGCIRTDEITRPSFKHDLFSMSYPLFVTAAHAPVLLPELERRGAKLLTARVPTGVLLPDGRSLILHHSRESNVAAFDALVPGDGEWTHEVAAAYADRILARLRQHITNFDEALLEVSILSPRDLERHNIDLVGGDPYSGACSIDQFYLFRPLAGGRNHATSVRGVYHIGASTHPGPG